MSWTRRAGVPLIGLLVAILSLGCESETLGPAAEDTGPALAFGPGFSAWSPAASIEAASPGAHENFNTAAVEGCPFISRDGKKFFLASTRPGGVGGIDIWVSTRASRDDPWGEPVNLGEPVNSEANDFCPTLARDGHTFYFVSTRDVEGACGGGDIYVTRMRGNGTFDAPRNLGCDVNSSATEFSPFPLPQSHTGPVLYFSSTRPNGGTGGDLYVTESHGGVFGPAEPVAELNSPVDDGHPNVRRDGLEIYFYSARTDLPGAQGGNDIHVATRASTSEPWSAPVNLGAAVNSPASETRPSLSWDGTRLYWGSSREGGEGASDVYVATREKDTGG